MDREVLKSGLLEENFVLSKEQEEDFFEFSRLLVEWNKKMNLTAVTEDKEISIKHFLDSVVPALKLNFEENSKIIDVGTGAGFPGIPIKIIRKDIDFTLLDSLNKRITFLNEVKEKLKLEKINMVHCRAEDGGQNKDLRGKFDYAVSRAVAPLKILSEYCIPFLKVGGKFASFKSFDIDEEINEAKSMIGNLGGKIEEIMEVKIPQSDLIRKIVVIEKIKETPKQFPRKPNKIK